MAAREPDQPRRRSIEILSEDECLALLARGRIGRVGVTIGALPAILPVGYRFVAGSVLFWSGEQSRLTAALAGTVVAFEVDEADPDRRTGWSVHLVGVAQAGTWLDDRIVAEVAGLRSWVAGARPQLIEIRPERISGRRLPGASGEAGSPIDRPH